MLVLTRQEKIIVFFLIGASIVGLGVLYYRRVSASSIKPAVVEDGSVSRQEPQVIHVDISGAVWRPRVYKLKKGARVNDLVEKAGLRPDADVDAVNRAELLSDGQKVVIPVKGSSLKKYEGAALSKKININTATEEELRKLPHIGEVRSRDIINYRNTHGPFTTVEELKDVPGIGERAFEELKDLVVVG